MVDTFKILKLKQLFYTVMSFRGTICQMCRACEFLRWVNRLSFHTNTLSLQPLKKAM